MTHETPTGLISVDDALRIIEQNRPALPVEPCALDGCLGRTLADPVIAHVTQPPLAVSAMDGYAVRLSDVAQGGAALTCIGESPAGQPFPGEVGTGQAVRIFTGGAVPTSADHIVIQENTFREGDLVQVPGMETGPRHIRAAGIDFRAGDLLIEAGTRLGPAHLAAAAAANHSALAVYGRPRVALLANGDELREPGMPLGPGEIIASSRFALAALVRDWGGDAVDMGIAPDRIDAIEARISNAEDADILVPIGGASVGDHDHMRAAFDRQGFEPLFEKIAVKPGKPTWLSRRGDQIVLGLPGNPASALVCAHLFLKPLISGKRWQTLTARLSTVVPANGRRESFLRARVSLDANGGLQVTPAENQDSALIHPFLTSNALLRRRVDAPELAANAPVDVILMDPL